MGKTLCPLFQRKMPNSPNTPVWEKEGSPHLGPSLRAWSRKLRKCTFSLGGEPPKMGERGHFRKVGIPHPSTAGRGKPTAGAQGPLRSWDDTTKETPNIEPRHRNGGRQRPQEAGHVSGDEPLGPSPPLGSEPFLPLRGPSPLSGYRRLAPSPPAHSCCVREPDPRPLRSSGPYSGPGSCCQ